MAKRKKTARPMSASERQMAAIKKEAGGALKNVKIKKRSGR